MKKFYLIVVLICNFLISFAQSNEVEPNNIIGGTASPLLSGDPTDGTLTVIDSVDYHRLYFNYSGNFVLYVNVTNTGSGAPKTLNINYFNTARINNQYVGNFFSTSVELNAGNNFSFPVVVCGLTKDSFYIKLKGNGAFTYNIEWYPSNTYNTDDLFYGYNNTPAVAMPFLYNVQKEASVGYKYWGSGNFYDTLDYYTTTLPVGNYNLINLKINAINADCNYDEPGSSTSMRYACYKNGNPTPFATGFVGGANNVPWGAAVTTTVPLNNMAQGDVLLVKYSATSPFGYRFRYGLVDEFEPDNETGNVCQNGPIIAPNQVVTGNVGEYDNNADEFIDQADYYKIVLPHDGAIKFFVKGRNDECVNENNYLQADIIDFNCNYLSDGNLIEWNNNASCGTILLDTTKIRAFVAGTYYIRLYTNYHVKLSYSFKYQLVDSTAGEPSENFSPTSTNTELIAVGQTKNGHLRFHKNALGYDPQDAFRTNIPQGGSVRVYLKATYRGDDTVANNNFNNERLQFSGLGVGKLMPKVSNQFIVPDFIYRDTFLICGLDTGVTNFVLNTQKAWEYEIRYELADTTDTDVDVEPNGTFAQATFAPHTTVKKGHIQYYGSNPLIDSYDYYKIIVGTSDSVKIMMQGTNKSCENNKRITVKGYNKNQVQIFSRVLGLNNNVLANQTITDSIKIFVTAPDTIYLAFEATAPFNYQFNSKVKRPTSFFTIEGDSSACIGSKTFIARNTLSPGEGITYNWSLPLGGGTLTVVDSVATVVWNATGNRSIQLFLSNAAGNSSTKTRNVIVTNTEPAGTPVVFNFARTLSITDLPPGATCQWYRNNILIASATQTAYTTTLAGSYTVRFINFCGLGPAAAPYNFAVNAIAQTITFPHVPPVTMSPTAKVKLNATASSGLPITYQKISGQGNIVNDSLVVTGVGTIIIKATQPGDTTYSTATDKYDTITVIKGNQFIIFDSIPDQIFSTNAIELSAVTSAQQPVSYQILSGNGFIFQGDIRIYMTGAGSVTARISQPGNQNYNAAPNADRTFCIGVRTLTPITGDANPCINTYRYNTQKIKDANYIWTLSSGGILTFNKDTAWVQWQTPGTHTLNVKANSPCDPIYSSIQSFTVNTSSNVPAIVSNMQPANYILNQQLPLTLSWIPGNNTVNYDLYIWDSASVQPVAPYVANLNTIQYTLPTTAPLPYNRPYKWRVVSKNPCSQTVGPVQQFRLIPLPDLIVSEVLAPATATSGQTITISWKVTNIGPGRTNTDDTWSDKIYLALDTVPIISFQNSPNWDASSFSSLTANGRPLLIGTKNRPVSLDSGEFYMNTVDFTLPLSYNFPLYVYVVTGNQNTSEKLLQFSNDNDSARKEEPIIISLAPTPDLRTESVFAPLSTFSGSTINVIYRVKNYGVVTPVGVGWGDAIYLSQNPLFDSSNAIRLQGLKSNGSYYPNTFDAGVSNSTQLLPDSSYTKTMQAVIPNFIFGNWFIYIKANNNKYLYEGALSNNNVNQAPLQVYLTPTPNLTINALTVPVTNASTTQPIGINWNIKNEGFADNFEKGKGHDMYDNIESCSCSSSGVPGSVCLPPPILIDHPLLGSSYWLDRMYLSTDSTGLNLSNALLIKEVKHGTQEYMGLLYPDTIRECNFFIRKENIATALHPGKVFPTVANFTIPTSLQPGNYYVYVHTNPTNTVFEYPGAPQIKRSALPINIQRPDLVVSSISAPPTSTGGTILNINYNVLNSGLGAVFNHKRNDRLYISNFSSFDASAQVVATQSFTENVPVGTAVPHNFPYFLPPATTGNKYFYIQTNYDSLHIETNEINNLSVSTVTNVSAATAVNLFVSAIPISDTIRTILPAYFTYTVTNIGAGTTSGTWTDSVFISCSNTFSPATSHFIAKRTITRAISMGGSYTESFPLTIPSLSYDIDDCFPQVMHWPGYFYVKTNADNGVYEAAATNNNVTSSGSKVILNPLVDHIVTYVSAPDTTTVGFAYPTSWIIKNIGYNPLNNSYSLYREGLFFSTDSIADIADTKFGDYLKYTTLNRNKSQADFKSPITPTLLAGDYYVYAHTNHVNSIPVEKILTNNVNFIRNANGSAKKIHVIRPDLADLTDSIISAPTSVAIGQPITIVYKVTNTGIGVTYPGTSFQNQIALSSDFVLSYNGGDRLLVTRNRNTVVLPGQSYLDTITATIPLNTPPGNYVLIGEANSNDAVVESNTNNNFGYNLLTVFSPPISDLIVTNVQKPDTVLLGYTMDTAKWIIKNASGNEARGYTSDGLYLTASNLFDSTAVLLGVLGKTINMAAQELDTLVMAPLVMGVVEGNYNVVVKTDLLNNLPESNKDNNVGISVTPIYVKVKELKLNIAETNTLFNTNRYYKLNIPDSLLGSTLLITLKSNDSLTKRNEMFIGGGYVPTPSNYDYQFEIPNYGNQQIVINSVTSSVFYINIRCVSQSASIQNITLKAVKLPFALLSVQTNSGGNIGNVTVKIKGSLFTQGMTAKLSNGTTTINASVVYFTNSTQVYATFPLQGKPLGIYNVTLQKLDSSVAVLGNAFSIVPANNGGLLTGGGVNTGSGNGNEPGCDPGAASGLNSQLVVDLLVPSRVLTNRPVLIQINYTNPTNFDISAQSRILYSEAGIKMAFTKAGVPTGTTSLYLELVETGGPPGIIRAGGSGTILVHCISPATPPQPNNFVLFKLK